MGLLRCASEHADIQVSRNLVLIRRLLLRRNQYPSSREKSFLPMTPSASAKNDRTPRSSPFQVLSSTATATRPHGSGEIIIRRETVRNRSLQRLRHGGALRKRKIAKAATARSGVRRRRRTACPVRSQGRADRSKTARSRAAVLRRLGHRGTERADLACRKPRSFMIRAFRRVRPSVSAGWLTTRALEGWASVHTARHEKPASGERVIGTRQNRATVGPRRSGSSAVRRRWVRVGQSGLDQFDVATMAGTCDPRRPRWMFPSAS